MPGTFFPVTGKFDELVRIRAAIEANDGRLTSGSSYDLDMWLEMEDEWFKIHRKEVLANVQAFQDMAAAIVKAWEGVGPTLIKMAEAWAAATKPDTVMPPSQTSWDTKQTHSDCPHCEDAVECAIQDAEDNGKDNSVWTVYSPGDMANPQVAHKGRVIRA